MYVVKSSLLLEHLVVGSLYPHGLDLYHPFSGEYVMIYSVYQTQMVFRLQVQQNAISTRKGEKPRVRRTAMCEGSTIRLQHYGS